MEKQPYELDEPTERMPWRRLIILAIILWVGASWLA